MSEDRNGAIAGELATIRFLLLALVVLTFLGQVQDGMWRTPDWLTQWWADVTAADWLQNTMKPEDAA